MSQARKGTKRGDAMRRAAGGGEARQPRDSGGQRQWRGRMDPKRERELQQGRHRAMSGGKKDKESHRSFPGEVVEEEGELLVRRRKCRSLVGGEEERWREELRGWSVRRERHHGFPEGRRQRRERRERREEPAGTHSAISGTGPREGERGKRPRGRVGSQHCTRTAIG